MDILEILKKSGKDLYPEDLDFFETELATGGHYISGGACGGNRYVGFLHKPCGNGDEEGQSGDAGANIQCVRHHD